MARTPEMVRTGMRPHAGTRPPSSPFPPLALRGTERPLTAQMQGVQFLRTGFRSIPLAAPQIASASSAWYGLGSWRSPDDLGQQGFLAGYRVELGPCNPNASSDPQFAGAPAAWGNDRGTGAAIVVGLNLPVNTGEWTSGPNNIPFVEPPSGPLNLAQPAEQLVFHFAPGTWEGTPAPVVFRATQTTPLAITLGAGAKLDVALVVARGTVHNITNTPGIVTRCYVELAIASTFTRGEIQQ